MSIVVDIPFTEFRGRNWHEMERDELQKVFSEACDEQLKPHGLRVRATIVHNPMGDGEKWFMALQFIDETERKGALLREMSFFFLNEREMEDKIKWIPSRRADIRTAQPSMIFTFSYGRLRRINDQLMFLRLDFGSEIKYGLRSGKRGTAVQSLTTT